MRPGQRRYCALLVSNWLPGGANIANIDQKSHFSTHIQNSLESSTPFYDCWFFLPPLPRSVTAQSFKFPASICLLETSLAALEVLTGPSFYAAQYPPALPLKS